MWFDVDAALAEIMENRAPVNAQPEPHPRANRANRAKQGGKTEGRLAYLAHLARPRPSALQSPTPAPVTSLPDLRAADDTATLEAFAAGYRSPGAIATATEMGGTRAWQAVDRLTRAGRLGWAKGYLMEVQA